MLSKENFFLSIKYHNSDTGEGDCEKNGKNGEKCAILDSDIELKNIDWLLERGGNICVGG